MWLGACTSSVGTWMQKVAQSWLVWSISGSPFLLGLDAFLGEIPIFLFSLVGGVVADRVERRRILLASQVIQMTCAFTLTLLIVFHVVRVWHILALSFATGLAQAFGGPAYQALLPMLVDKEDLLNAIALNSIQINVARVLGPVLGGLAMTKLGSAWCFGLNGLSFVAVIISLLTISARFVPAPAGETMLASMRQGIGFIRRKRAMGGLIALAFCMTALAIPMTTFLPVFAKEVFRDGPAVFTLMLACFGAGSITGALVVAASGNTGGKGRVALTMLVALGGTISGFALSRHLALSCILLFLAGGALVSAFANITSLVQQITSNEMRGRVMSVYNVSFRGGMPFGSLLTGWLVPMFTAPAVLAFNGLLLGCLGLYFLLVQRRVAAL
jgi:predicted MFS family arabinose efflux permease